MTIVYGGNLATHKSRCSGQNWTTHLRCNNEITYRAVDESGATVDVPTGTKVYCGVHKRKRPTT